MRLQLDYTPELNTEAVYRYILDDSQYYYSSQPPASTGFSLTSDHIPAGRVTITMFIEVKYFYNVVQGKSVVSGFDVVVPIKQTLRVSVKSHLLISNTTTPEQASRIRAAFRSYDPESTSEPVDPVEFAKKQLASHPDLTADMFMVLSSFLLDKHNDQGQIVPRVPFRKHLDAILAIYDGTDKRSRLDIAGEQLLSDYFTKQGYSAVLVRDELLLHPSNRRKDSLREIEYVKPADMQKFFARIDDLTALNSRGLQCPEGLRTQKIRIVSIPTIPEFRTEWVWQLVELGCVKTHLYWPKKAYKRDTLRVLYACVGHPGELVDHIKQQLVSCATGAAFAGAVVGIWASNLDLALVAFKSLFFKCVKSEIAGTMECLFPELVVLEEITEWQEFID